MSQKRPEERKNEYASEQKGKEEADEQSNEIEVTC